jgi:GGDEF domain-containing protein
VLSPYGGINATSRRGELERIAYVGALTRLANRRQFDEALERERRLAIRELELDNALL